MFALRRPEPESAAPAAAAPSVDLDAIARAIDALSEGRVDVEALPEPVAQALSRVEAILSQRNTDELERTVSFSMQSSESMAAIANAAGEVRRMDDHAQAMAAAVEQLNQSIANITGIASRSADDLENCVSAAAEARSAVDTTRSESRKIETAFTTITARVASLETASARIAEIVDTIAQIADQTNLLALNATIEAARAGDAGKGFAVVAGEVKALSGQTAKATETIRESMAELQSEVGSIAAAVRESGGAVEAGLAAADLAETQVQTVDARVRDSANHVQEIARLMDEQTGATRELSGSVAGIADGATRASTKTDAVIQAASGSESMIGKALADLSGRHIEDFVLHCAKSDHLLWKKRLSGMLVGTATLNPDELSDHKSCRFGKWYESARAQYAGAPAFEALEAPHAAVHSHGREAARLFALGDQSGAEAEVAQMNAASDQVIAGIDRLIASRT